MNNQMQDNDKQLILDQKKIEYDRLWEYFKYHAKQRLETFRFFFIMATIVASGFLTFIFKKTSITSSKQHFHSHADNAVDEANGLINISHTALLWIMLGLGIFLIIFSIVFWLLDNRNNTMICESRKMLVAMEKDRHFKNEIFTRIDNDTKENCRIRFHHCLGVIFILFIVIGGAIIIYSICSLSCS